MFTDDYESCGDILACNDCMSADTSGEYSPDRPANLPDVWSAIPFGFIALPGGTHADSCDRDPDTSDCECDQRGFVAAGCDACGDFHHGDKHAYTLFRSTRERARREHRRALESVRLIRADRSRYPAGMLDRELAVATQWRTFLADRYREERQYTAWMARYAAPVAA